MKEQFTSHILILLFKTFFNLKYLYFTFTGMQHTVRAEEFLDILKLDLNVVVSTHVMLGIGPGLLKE